MAKCLAFTGRVKGYRSLKNLPLHRWKPKRKRVVVNASIDALLNLGLDLFWSGEALQGLSEIGLRRGDKGTLRMKGLRHQDAEVGSTDDCREGHKSLFVVQRGASAGYQPSAARLMARLEVLRWATMHTDELDKSSRSHPSCPLWHPLLPLKAQPELEVDGIELAILGNLETGARGGALHILKRVLDAPYEPHVVARQIIATARDLTRACA